MISHKFSLENYFQKILYRIDNWINDGSGWIVESSESQYINVSIYRTLSGSSYMKLSEELRSSKKRTITIKNKDQKCFLWCHDKHINPVKIYPERLTRKDKKNLLKILIMMELNFLCEKKILAGLKQKNNIFINVFCYENRLVFPIYISDLKFESTMDFLLLINGDKSHAVYIKGFDR